MGIIIDIILIAILILSTFLGYKKGLVKWDFYTKYTAIMPQ